MKLKIKYWLKLWELRLSEKLGVIEPETLIIAEDILFFSYKRKNLPVVMVIDDFSNSVRFVFSKEKSILKVQITILGDIWIHRLHANGNKQGKFNRGQILAFYSTFGKYI